MAALLGELLGASWSSWRWVWCCKGWVVEMPKERSQHGSCRSTTATPQSGADPPCKKVSPSGFC